MQRYEFLGFDIFVIGRLKNFAQNGASKFCTCTFITAMQRPPAECIKKKKTKQQQGFKI